jgi:hypothetical protein
MRKALFTVLGLNLVLEGLTSARLVFLPFRLEEFDASTHGGLVLYGFAALSAAASIVWFLKYSDTESSLALGLGLLSTFHICMVIACLMISMIPGIACLMISMIPGVVGHGLLFAAFVFLFVNRSKCLRVAED